MIQRLFLFYVKENELVEQDILQNIKVRGCSPQPPTLKRQFYHLMLYYPDFAFLFFWRINRRRHKWKHHFTPELPCKIFSSSNISGGMVCYHPYATVINAKSIGSNFEFRNGLTIGNKASDNSLLPTIGNNVWIGANCVIIGDITIGDHVIIGAGSVVVKDIPNGAVVAGNPAKIIRKSEE